jgi:hypothetical protein
MLRSRRIRQLFAADLGRLSLRGQHRAHAIDRSDASNAAVATYGRNFLRQLARRRNSLTSTNAMTVRYFI